MRLSHAFVGLILASLPFVAHAESGAVLTDSGALLHARLETLAEGALPLEDLEATAAAKNAWAAEVKRYAERSTELRTRCAQEIRKANRDTIADRAGQCLRSDLLLELTYRRKQQDWMAANPAIPEPAQDDVIRTSDAWSDAASAVVDGIDAGVFGTIDVLRAAKKNLHETYRAPMLLAFTHARLAAVRSALAAVAAASLTYADQLEDPLPFLIDMVPCLEMTHDQRVIGSSVTTLEEASTWLGLSAGTLRGCVAGMGS